MSELQIFSNAEFDLSVEPRGDSFIVRAPGLARGLGYHETKDMLRLIPDAHKGEEITPTPGGNQLVKHVTEAGFYRAIGQRTAARIKDPLIRTEVERFQEWVYSTVLPALRRGQRPSPLDQPVTYTWAETAAIIHQRWGHDFGDATLRRLLRSGGILKQGMAEPKRAYRDWFWFTGTAWEIHPHAIPFLVRKVDATVKELREFRFLQTRLELDEAARDLGGAA